MTPRLRAFVLAAPLAALVLAAAGIAHVQTRAPPKEPPAKVAAPTAAAPPAGDIHDSRPPPKDPLPKVPPPKTGPKPHQSWFDSFASFLGFTQSMERIDPGDPPLKGPAIPPVKGGPTPPVKGSPS